MCCIWHVLQLDSCSHAQLPPTLLTAPCTDHTPDTAKHLSCLPPCGTPCEMRARVASGNQVNMPRLRPPPPSLPPPRPRLWRLQPSRLLRAQAGCSLRCLSCELQCVKQTASCR